MAASQASSNQYGLSDQDFADLQQIRSSIPAGDPRAAKIDTLLASKPAAPKPPTATIGAAPTGVLPWLRNLESDVRYGSNSTGIGKFLHTIGMQPTTAGIGAADETLASPITGPIHAAEGIAQIPSKPWQGIKQLASGGLEAASIPLAFSGPEVNKAGPVVERAAAKVGELGEAAANAKTATTNAIARTLRNPATAQQARMGTAGSVKNFLPQILQKWMIPDIAIPKGELGTATNPGTYAMLPTRTPASVLREEAASAAEKAASQAEPAAQAFPKPMRPLVGTPEEFQVYDEQMSRLKQEASDAGTYSAARGKVGKPLNYQQRIKKKF